MHRYDDPTDDPMADIVDFSRPSYGRCDLDAPIAHSPEVCPAALMSCPAFAVP